MTLQRGKIFGLVLFKRRVTDQEVGPALRRQSGALREPQRISSVAKDILYSRGNRMAADFFCQ